MKVRTEIQRTRARLRREGDAVVDRLAAECGPAFTLPEIARLLGKDARAVKTMERQKRLIGISRSGQWQYPCWQFDAGTVRPWVEPICTKLGGSGPALHFLTVRRFDLGMNGGGQSLLAFLLANEPDIIEKMQFGLEMLTRDEPQATARTSYTRRPTGKRVASSRD